MPVNLSIKNAPDDVVRRLKERAARHHRSLQGELMAIVESAARQEAAGLLTPRQALERARAAGLRAASSSVGLIRRMREGRHGDRRR
ncbi:MAG TPA: Arc family DNA-binding protein [Anaeromyxobacteraceae bacterium]|nr:Arc family DNA-binding protein [Anaeromyxobacteraceae bacterium]